MATVWQGNSGQIHQEESGGGEKMPRRLPSILEHHHVRHLPTDQQARAGLFQGPAGTIHAIGKGVRLIEIQQNSDLTFRLYDYLRKDKDGNYRPLHIEEALKVINYKKYEPEQAGSSLLAGNRYFKVERREVNGELLIEANKDSFISFTFLSGKGKVDDIEYKEFDTFFLPYKKSCLIKGEGTLIVSSIDK